MDRAYRNSFTPGQANAVNAGLNEIPTDRKTAADLLWELAKPGMRGQEPAWIEDAHRSLNELAADENLVNIDASQQIHM